MATEGTHFLAALEPCLDLWKSIDIRAQAATDQELGWRCETLRATLIHEDRQIPGPWMRPPAVPDFLVVHEYWPVTRLRDLVSMLESGELLISGEHLIAKRPVGSGQHRPASYYVRTYDRTAASERYGLDWKTVVLTGWESLGSTPELQRARERVDAQLQAGNPPWDGVADVKRTFFGMSTDEAVRFDFMSWELVAPLFLRFGRCALDENKMSLEVQVGPTTNFAEIGISMMFLFGDQTVGRKRIEMGKSDIEADGDSILVSEDLPETASGAMCVLTFRDVAVDRKRLFKAGSLAETPQWLAFRALIGGADELSTALRTAEGNDPFEHAVSTLLHLLGFTTGHYGQRTFGGDMTDLFAAHSGAEWFLVVECTTRQLDLATKIAKLVTRAKEVARAMPGDVHPVLVTRQPRTDISDTVREDAAREKVVLVTGDDLDGLVQLATELPLPDRIKNHLLRLVPAEVR